MDQILTPEFWEAQIEFARSASWVVIPLLLIAGIIGWKSKRIVDDRKIRGMMAEINTREQRLQQAHDRQELVANQVKILRDAIMQEYTKLKKARKMSLAWISTERYSPNSRTAPSQSAESLAC
jgi:hypothetical protein